MAVEGVIASNKEYRLNHKHIMPITAEAVDMDAVTSENMSSDDSSSTNPNKDPITLMTLPAEIRLLIFEQLFDAQITVVQDAGDLARLRLERQPPILRVFQKLRIEGKPIWLKQTTFISYYSFDNYPFDKGDRNIRVSKWLKLMGPDLASKVQNLKLRFHRMDVGHVFGEVNHRVRQDIEDTEVVDITEEKEQWPHVGPGILLDEVKTDRGFYAYHQESLIRKDEIMEAFELSGLGLKEEALTAWCQTRDDMKWNHPWHDMCR